MADLARRVGTLLGVAVLDIQALQGGGVSSVSSVRLSDRRQVVVKRDGPCETEARMLRAIADTGCAVPEVLAVGADTLILSHLAEGSGSPEGWAAAGHAIARLHACEGPSYGWGEDARFGDVPCPAAPSDTWPAFWAKRRLLAWPDHLPKDLVPPLERLADRLEDLLPTRPEASLLHGDLWGGNVLLDGDLFSGLIDPACYFGDAEVDLAMLTLFGNPPETFWTAYGSLPPGWQQRRAIYQLWPALVHLRLFGGGYLPMVERLLQSAESNRHTEST